MSDNVRDEASPEGRAGGSGSAAEPGSATGAGNAGSDAEEEAEGTPVRRALDLLVFAPVGVALTVVEDLPALVVKGRQRFETDIRNARLIGEFLVRRRQRDVIDRVGKLIGGRPSGATAEPSVSSSNERSAPSPSAAPAKPEPDPADGLIVDEALAGYDTLSASQVVRRLESLELQQLRAVHRHEASHRNRRTILNRAHQLLEMANADADPAVDHAPHFLAGAPGPAAAEPDHAAE